MASVKHADDHVIARVDPGAAYSGANLSSIEQDIGLAGDGCIYLKDAESGIDRSVATSQTSVNVTDQTIICVICLELVDEEAAALPCRHNHFHFSCLGTWLQQNRSCPLCKVVVSSVRYHDQKSESTSIFHLPDLDSSQSLPARRRHQHLYARTHNRSRHSDRRSPISDAGDRALRFRRYIYERSLYSLYVGNNRVSRYRNITPAVINSNSTIVSSAKKWIRRELRALDPFEQSTSLHHPLMNADSHNQFRNNEFLLEYIVAILKHIDLKGSAGQAEVLLKEHLGSRNARLFLHELENWLRSPFETLEEWDAYIQYPKSGRD